MAEYIDRQLAVEQITETIKRYPSSFYNGITAARYIIDKIPSADVAPVRHGWWIPHRLDDGYTTWTCSDCGTVGLEAFHYCPNCGAKMDKEKHNAETI